MTDTSLFNRFQEQGYMVVEGLLDPEQDLASLINDYAALLDTLTQQWFAEGKLPSTYAELPFEERFTQVIQQMEGGGWFQHFDIALPPSSVTLDTPIHLSQPVFNLLRNPRLLDVVEQLIGGEILVNPVQHVRLKPPQSALNGRAASTLTTRTDWHQDLGVLLPEADDTEMLTVWVAITDATEENGCLCVIPGSHRRDLITHCPGDQLHVPEKLLQGDPLPLPIKRGGAIFMHRRTLHSSLSNHSSTIRWSFDLRFQPIGQPTGRPAFPAFAARSHTQPELILNDADTWANLWLNARAQAAEVTIGAAFNRWNADAPACA